MEITEALRQFLSELLGSLLEINFQAFGEFIRDIAVAVSAVWAVWAGQKGPEPALGG